MATATTAIQWIEYHTSNAGSGTKCSSASRKTKTWFSRNDPELVLALIIKPEEL
jgi:hypothetical protein